MHLLFVYASQCRQLARDVQWDDQALCDYFRQGLPSDVKNLLLNFLHSIVIIGFLSFVKKSEQHQGGNSF
jgi:hypothetical protein